MRLAFICFSRSLGGLELAHIRLAKELQQRGHLTIIIAPEESPLIERSRQLSIPSEIITPKLQYGDFFAAIKLASFLRKHNIQITTIAQSRDINVAVLASYLIPYVKLVFFQQMQSGVDKRDFLHRWMYGRLSHWITLTRKMCVEVLQRTTMQEVKVSVIPLGSDLSKFNYKDYNKKKARAVFNLPQKRFIVTEVARLDPQKGQEEFLRAIGMLADKYPKLLAVLVGEETKGEIGFKSQLEILSRELGIENNVRFIPFTEDVPAILAASDLYVLPSHSETFGFSTIEAMAMKKAVIATNAGGVPEIIDDGIDGLLVNPKKPLELARAIERMIVDVEFRSQCARAAHKKAVTKFDFRKQVDEFEEIYERVVISSQ